MRSSAKSSVVWVASGIMVLVSALALVGGTVLPQQTGGVIIEPNVYLRPSASWADLHFSEMQTFDSEVGIAATGITLDGITFSVEKTPRSVPRADVLITIWAPAADPGSPAVRFLATSDPRTQVWFNVTGLRSDAVYRVYVDGISQPTVFSAGRASLYWISWSTHTVDFVPLIDNTPPVANAGGDRTGLVNETLRFDGAASADDTLIARYQWNFGDGTVVEGVTVEHRYSAPGDYFASLTVWDAMGYSSSDSILVHITGVSQPPTPDSVPPAQISDLHLVEWGSDYAILEWTAPGDDGTIGLAGAYDARITQAGPFNETAFLVAQSLPTTPPRAAGTSERLIVTGLVADAQYWFAVRSGDEVPNWSPISNVVALRTLAAGARLTTISSVSYDPTTAELEVVFSGSMNQSSVEEALVISPELTYEMEWASDAHLMIQIQTPLSTDSTYVLAIQPQAVDNAGTPLARSFTFRFAGATAPPNPFIAPVGISIVYVIVMLAGLAGLAEGLVLVAVLFARNRTKTRRLHDVIAAQVIRALRMGERVQRLGDDALLRVAARPNRRK